MASKPNGQFPELTADIGSGGQYQTAAPGAAPLGQKVTAALREALGWRPRATDPKGFVAALNSSFEVYEQDGHTEWRWTPRSYAVQADMGAVTGAQASIYSRAKAALDHATPLVEGLTPLDPATDIDKSEAIRSLVIAEMRELIDELGTVGGPRLPRVDGLFSTLLGASTFKRPQETAGLFGELRDQFGLDRSRVNTVSEEQNLTNFLIVVDHFMTLRESWKALASNDPDNQAFGTQLVLLSRSFAVIVESVQQVYQIMDAVLLGPADRQTIRLALKLDKNTVTLTIAELLDWVERFAQEEAKRIIDEAGLAGVLSFRPTLANLTSLVEDAAELSTRMSHQNGNRQDGLAGGFSLPQNFGHIGVCTSLSELGAHLRDAYQVVDSLDQEPEPVLKGINPTLYPPDTKALIIMFGENFSRDAHMSAFLSTEETINDKAIQAESVNVLNEIQLIASFDTSAAHPDTYNVLVRTGDGEISMLPHAYTVRSAEPALEVTGLNPSTGVPGQVLKNVEVVGEGLSAGDQLIFKGQITATELKDDQGTWRTTITIPAGLASGLYIVGVRKVGGRTSKGPATFLVEAKAQSPEIEEVFVHDYDSDGKPAIVDIIGDNLDSAHIAGIDLGLGDKGRVVSILKNKPNLLRIAVELDPSVAQRELTLSVQTQLFTQPSVPMRVQLPFQKIHLPTPLPVPIIMRLDSATFEQAATPPGYTITGAGTGLRRGHRVRVRGADGKWVDTTDVTFADDQTTVTLRVSATPSEKWELEITDTTVLPEQTVKAQLRPKTTA